ncbi:MAG: endonuclease/exonuclease/phosphatase family protein [Planctomycetia bacterium]|nr:endonuclease/exonuclease/phosphatase family protein [Planctomycetia bacterium]
MLKSVLTLLVGLSTLCGAFVAHADEKSRETLRVMTFNIRLSFGEVGKPTEWKHRKGLVAEMIRRGNYDFVGIQEAILTPLPNLNQVKDIQALLPEYGVIVRSRSRSATEGESTPILYRKDRWEPDAEAQGCFWLSDTPDVPASITWENACPRTVVWGKFYEIAQNAEGENVRTGKTIYFFNTHFDHVSEKARRLSAIQIARFIADRNDPAPVLLTGDFNCGESSVAIRYLRGEEVKIGDESVRSSVPFFDTFRAVHPDETDVQTFHNFGTSKYREKIDYVFATPGLKTLSANILRDKGEIYPSDHYPLDAELAW